MGTQEFSDKSLPPNLITRCLQLIRSESNETETSFESEAFDVAETCLKLFIQANWTGPPLELSTVSSKLSLTLEEFESSNDTPHCRDHLSVDGETVYGKIDFPLLLAISRLILSNPLESNESRSKLWLINELKSIYIHQNMLEEKCESLKTEAMSCIKSLQAMDSTTMHDNNRAECGDTDAEWKLLALGMCRDYFEHSLCKQLLEEVTKQSNLEINLSGVPGKRTRYQQKEIAQLVLTVHGTNNSRVGVEEPPQYLPVTETLNDDTVYDQMKLSGQLDDCFILHWLDQCLILALAEENKYVKGEGDVEITQEETSAYLNYILRHPQDWSTQYKALLIRSVTEKGSGRRVERSLRQIEGLCSLSSGSKGEVEGRLRGVFAARLPPTWQAVRSKGELEMELGLYASAMETFNQLSLWHPLIVCCQRAGRTGKAEELIRERLAVEETPILYCSLSDVTADPQYWHKAWELSNHRSSRAMRGLAYHHLRACEYEESMGYFEKTLAINPLQLPCWFSYGCASLASASYDKAATAFRRCVNLNSDNFEAWNNLAAAYARSHQKPRAFSVLQDAIKCSYDNWKVWENYTLIGSDCGQIAEVIRGAHRILDINGKWQDEQVVEHLTKCVMDNIIDATDTPCSVHRSSLLKLLGHTTSKVTNSSTIWRCYGRLILDDKENSSDNIERGIQCLQKGYRCATNKPGWEKDEEKCKLHTEMLIELVDSYKMIGSKKYMSTARLQLKGHIAKLKHGHTDPVSKEISSDYINSVVGELETIIATLPSPTE